MKYREVNKKEGKGGRGRKYGEERRNEVKRRKEVEDKKKEKGDESQVESRRGGIANGKRRMGNKKRKKES